MLVRSRVGSTDARERGLTEAQWRDLLRSLVNTSTWAFVALDYYASCAESVRLERFLEYAVVELARFDNPFLAHRSLLMILMSVMPARGENARPIAWAQRLLEERRETSDERLTLQDLYTEYGLALPRAHDASVSQVRNRKYARRKRMSSQQPNGRPTRVKLVVKGKGQAQVVTDPSGGTVSMLRTDAPGDEAALQLLGQLIAGLDASDRLSDAERRDATRNGNELRMEIVEHRSGSGWHVPWDQLIRLSAVAGLSDLAARVLDAIQKVVR